MRGRSLAAVAAGYGLVVAAVGIGLANVRVLAPWVLEPSGRALLVGKSALLAFVGGWVAAWVAGERELFHALLVALALGATLLLILLLRGSAEGLGTQAALMAVALAAPPSGGWLRARTKRAAA